MKEAAFSTIIPIAALLVAIGGSPRWTDWGSGTDERRLLVSHKAETMTPTNASRSTSSKQQQAGDAGTREETVRIQKQTKSPGRRGARAMEGSRGVKAAGLDPINRENIESAAFGMGDGKAVLDPAGLPELSSEKGGE